MILTNITHSQHGINPIYKVYAKLKNANMGSDLLCRSVTASVPSAYPGLTFVFGMGTGVSPGLLPPFLLHNVL